MSKVRIYQPTKTAMQSGKARMHQWILEFVSIDDHFVEPVMGWTGTYNNEPQIRLRFSTREAALAYAEQHGLEVLLEMGLPINRKPVQRRYSDNFRHNRVN